MSRTMSRVMLFVQTGSGRPKMVPTPGWLGEGDTQHVREMAASKPGPKCRQVWIRALGAADRWWLVECENADKGRYAIIDYHHADWCKTHTSRTSPYGRVIASGGEK
jgi:hypothetical protein